MSGPTVSPLRRGSLPLSGRIALAAVIGLWAVAAISPFFASRAREIRLDERLLPPSAAHPFGTDDLGRDLLARVIAATPISLAIGLVAAAVSLGIGFTVGATAGFFGGAVDLVLSRVIEVVLCFPVLFLLLALAAFLPPSPATIVLAIGVTAWPGDARYARAEVLRIRQLDYTRAATAAGASTPRILVRHVLPNALAPLIVSAAFGIGWAILAEAALSFLGVGLPSPAVSWGGILAAAPTYIEEAWWLALFPGVALFVTVSAYNLLAEGLRAATMSQGSNP
ncbi:MAG TPA: ABC transporter permease [Thermoanaerobaculia bacterium]|nr:ABC transporter permease [Thermoanaerobaculia bacterium]